jgi:predicted oxidoreductase
MISRVRVAPEGPELSRLVYGTWRLMDPRATGDAAPTPANVARRLRACLELGITTIDTAEIYGLYEVEELLGRALAQDPGLRGRLEIVTKCGIYVPCPRHPDRKVAYYNATADRIVRSAEKSLRLLGVEALDVLLVHRPDWLTAADETARGLEAVVEQGKVRHVGVSNYSPAQMELLASRLARPLVTNQIELGLLQRAALTDGTLDQCQRLRVHPMAWSPLGGGRLFSDSDPAAVRLRAALTELAPKHGDADPAALALAWVLAHPSRPLAVIGTNRIERLASLARADGITLSREDWYLLWTAAQGHKVP